MLQLLPFTGYHNIAIHVLLDESEALSVRMRPVLEPIRLGSCMHGAHLISLTQHTYVRLRVSRADHGKASTWTVLQSAARRAKRRARRRARAATPKAMQKTVLMQRTLRSEGPSFVRMLCARPARSLGAHSHAVTGVFPLAGQRGRLAVRQDLLERRLRT